LRSGRTKAPSKQTPEPPPNNTWGVQGSAQPAIADTNLATMLYENKPSSSNGNDPFAAGLKELADADAENFFSAELDDLHESPSMSWFDIEGLVDTIDSAVDTKLDTLFEGGKQQPQHQPQHQPAADEDDFGMAMNDLFPPEPQAPQAPQQHFMSRSNSRPVDTSAFMVQQSRVIQDSHLHPRQEHYPPQQQYMVYQQPHPHQRFNNVVNEPPPAAPSGGYFRPPYEAYRTSQLNQAQSPNKIMAGFDSLIRSFGQQRQVRGVFANATNGSPTTAKKGGKKAPKKAPKKAKESKTAAMETFKNLFGGGPGGRISPLAYDPAEAVAAANAASSGPAAAKSQLKRTNSAKKKCTKKAASSSLARSNSAKRESLVRSFSDVPPVTRTLSFGGSGNNMYDYTSVEGAIKSLLSGERAAPAREKSLGTGYHGTQLGPKSNSTGMTLPVTPKRAGSAAKGGRASPPTFPSPFGGAAAARDSKQSPASASASASTSSGEESYNLQDVIQQRLFSPPPALATSNTKTNTKKNSGNNNSVARCLSTKW